MAYDATKPAVADNYSTGYTQNIRDNFAYLMRWGEGDSVTGTPATNAKRYNPTTDLFEFWNGSAWATMPLAYLPFSGGTLTGTVNLTGGGTFQVGGNGVWHAGNLTPSNYAPLAGAGFSGAVTGTTFTGSGRLFGNGTTDNHGLGRVLIQQGGTPPSGSQGDVCYIW